MTVEATRREELEGIHRMTVCGGSRHTHLKDVLQGGTVWGRDGRPHTRDTPMHPL